MQVYVFSWSLFAARRVARVVVVEIVQSNVTLLMRYFNAGGRTVNATCGFSVVSSFPARFRLCSVSS